MTYKLFTLLSVLACLAACGVRPKDVDPPSGANDTQFPRTYPDPSTDPK